VRPFSSVPPRPPRSPAASCPSLWAFPMFFGNDIKARVLFQTVALPVLHVAPSGRSIGICSRALHNRLILAQCFEFSTVVVVLYVQINDRLSYRSRDINIVASGCYRSGKPKRRCRTVIRSYCSKIAWADPAVGKRLPLVDHRRRPRPGTYSAVCQTLLGLGTESQIFFRSSPVLLADLPGVISRPFSRTVVEMLFLASSRLALPQ